jgi:hypothetical protein
MRALFINESNENLTPGQIFAIDFLKVGGLQLISTSLQLKRGNLIFKDQKNVIWGIFSTGYIRKLRTSSLPWESEGRWQVLHSIIPPQHEGKRTMDDDEYIESARILLEKIRKSNKPKPEFSPSHANYIYRKFISTIRDLTNPNNRGYNEIIVTKREVVEAIKKLYDKYIKE